MTTQTRDSATTQSTQSVQSTQSGQSVQSPRSASSGGGRVTDPAQLHARFLGATNDHDVEALLDLYDPDGVAVELDGSLARGADELRAMCVGLTTAIARIDGSTRKLYVAGDVALSSARWTAEVVLPDGSTLTQEGSTAEVLRRQPDGTWRMLIDDPVFG